MLARYSLVVVVGEELALEQMGMRLALVSMRRRIARR